MTKFPILPMLNNSEHHRFSHKYRRTANFMSTYMFSDTGNTMEGEFCWSAGSKMALVQHGRHEIIPGWQYDNSFNCKPTGGPN